MVPAPRLTTPRLTLRVPRASDLDASFAMWSDPVVVRHVGGRPFTREETWAKLLRYVGHWSLLGFGYFAVEESETGRYVGEVGLADFRRAIDWRYDGVPECGWVLASWAHGRGFATEAVKAVVAWGEGNVAPHATWGRRSVCVIDPGNAASRHVAEKCGYAFESEARYHDGPVSIFVRG